MSVISVDRAKSGYALAHDEGEAFWLLGMLQTVKVGRSDNAGQVGMLEIVVPPGLGSPWHVHPEEDEWFYVLEGNLTFYVGDTRFDLITGGFAFGPKGVPHTFIGGGPQPARALVGFAPMQFEGFMREVGQPAPARELPPPHDGPPPDIARLAPIASATDSSLWDPRDRRPDDSAADLTGRGCARPGSMPSHTALMIQWRNSSAPPATPH